jgi:hypothetical protein
MNRPSASRPRWVDRSGRAFSGLAAEKPKPAPTSSSVTGYRFGQSARPVEGILADEQKPPPERCWAFHGQDRLQRFQSPSEEGPFERAPMIGHPPWCPQPVVRAKMLRDRRHVSVLHVLHEIRLLPHRSLPPRRVGIKFVQVFSQRRIESLPARQHAPGHFNQRIRPLRYPGHPGLLPLFVRSEKISSRPNWTLGCNCDRG